MNEIRVYSVCYKVFNRLTRMKKRTTNLSTRLLAPTALSASILAMMMAIMVIMMTMSSPALGSNDPGFARYQVILDKVPFGQPPPVKAPVAPPAPARPVGPTWAEGYRMTMLMVDDDDQPRIGLVNVKENYSFTLGAKDAPIDGIRLQSVDYKNMTARVDKGGDVQTIAMQEVSAMPVAAKPPSPTANTSATSVRDKYLQRRAELQKKSSRPPVQPKYTGEELEQHLRDYQMEVLRKGLPPLPVPLTPEMDNKLVEEGVLPPLEAGQ
jgi:hypothetical protein